VPDLNESGHKVAVAVVGDGPAGSALATELRRRSVDVVLIGPDAPWEATYGAWVDDIADVPGWDVDAVASVGHVVTDLRVVAESDRSIDRPYIVFDNERLRARLRADVRHLVGTVNRSARGTNGVELTIDRGRGAGGVDAAPASIEAQVVIDATGWPSRLVDGPSEPMGWQTAWGAVLAEPPSGPLGASTLMDFSDPVDGGSTGTSAVDVPTFAYAFDVGDGWLVEETVLASRTPIDPKRLQPLLARRLGCTVDELVDRAQRVETVEIPMGAPMRPPEAGNLVVPFGAAAGLAHPATGYQVATSLRIAPRVAEALADAHRSEADARAVARATWEAVWPTPRRRTRRLHEYGLDVVMRLDAAETRAFFETFFAMPAATWSVQMRSDVSPGEVAGVMARMFRAAPWALRRRLMSGDVRRLASALRG